MFKFFKTLSWSPAAKIRELERTVDEQRKRLVEYHRRERAGSMYAFHQVAKTFDVDGFRKACMAQVRKDLAPVIKDHVLEIIMNHAPELAEPERVRVAAMDRPRGKFGKETLHQALIVLPEVGTTVRFML